MRINFLVNEVFNGWEPTDTRLGGTEESVVRWAEELVKRGHDVVVWRNPTEGTMDVITHNKVVYKNRKGYPIPDWADICINVKSSDIPPTEPTLYLTNETNATDLDLSAYAGVIWPSQWADDNIPVNNSRRFILPHGYDSKKIYPGTKVPKQCFYASSPDRGLDTLLEAWPKVHEAHPDATLILTYGAPETHLPGVINLGEVDEETMNDIYRTSDIWCHPCNGGELFCMTGIKAQAAGCVPVIVPTMALAETVRHYYNATDDYAQTLIEALDDNRQEMRGFLEAEHYPDWEETAAMLEDIIKETLKT